MSETCNGKTVDMMTRKTRYSLPQGLYKIFEGLILLTVSQS